MTRRELAKRRLARRLRKVLGDDLKPLEKFVKLLELVSRGAKP